MKRRNTIDQPLEIRVREIKDLPLPEKQEKALEAISEFALLARRTVEQAWVAGKWLTAVKAELKHGEFRLWLKEHEISKSSAHRFMQVGKIEMSQLGTYNSMGAALESLKPDPLTEAQEKLKRLFSAYGETLREQLQQYWLAGEGFTKIADLGGVREYESFIRKQDLDRELIKTCRGLYERYPFQAIKEASVEELEKLLVS